LKGIRGSKELVLPRTGHMFRFSHPGAYSTAVAWFLRTALEPGMPDQPSLPAATGQVR
jgi:hypothetical protein